MDVGSLEAQDIADLLRRQVFQVVQRLVRPWARNGLESLTHGPGGEERLKALEVADEHGDRGAGDLIERALEGRDELGRVRMRCVHAARCKATTMPAPVAGKSG